MWAPWISGGSPWALPKGRWSLHLPSSFPVWEIALWLEGTVFKCASPSLARLWLLCSSSHHFVLKAQIPFAVRQAATLPTRWQVWWRVHTSRESRTSAWPLSRWIQPGDSSSLWGMLHQKHNLHTLRFDPTRETDDLPISKLCEIKNILYIIPSYVCGRGRELVPGVCHSCVLAPWRVLWPSVSLSARRGLGYLVVHLGGLEIGKPLTPGHQLWPGLGCEGVYIFSVCLEVTSYVSSTLPFLVYQWGMVQKKQVLFRGPQWLKTQSVESAWGSLKLFACSGQGPGVQAAYLCRMPHQTGFLVASSSGQEDSFSTWY